MSQPPQPAADAPSIDEIAKKTIDILSRIIKKPPLTAKLLSKPPFRYLHDIFSEIIRTTGYASGLYDDNEMVSDNVKDKDAKVAYLLKMVDCTGLATGVEVKANPLKIVAGMDPEDTNLMLQLMGKAILKKIDTSDAVKKVLNGEHQKKATVQPAKGSGQPPPQQAKAPAPAQSQSKAAPAEQKQSTSQPQQSSTAKSQASAPAEKTVKSSPSKDALPEKKTPQQSSSQPPPQREQKEQRDQRDQRDSRDSGEMSRDDEHDGPPSRPPIDNRDRDNGTVHGLKNDNNRSQQDLNANDGDDPSLSARASMVPKRRERPTTARPAPPKVRPAELAVVEEPAIAPSIIQEGTKHEDEDEDYIIVGSEQESKRPSQKEEQDSDEQHGGLVRKILDTKTKMEGAKTATEEDKKVEKAPKDKSAARREIEALRESIQILCRSTNPLAKTMDYMQEDVDGMNKELDMWKKECKKYRLALEEENRFAI
ncbi:TRAF3-interacting protein 1 [Blyttiomyces sp. JEL0837]|nr:TRAF3-interacting protein 1 [Blyttiomyces sp. JEL0837]